MKKTYPLCILDDATRTAVFAAFRSRHLALVAAKLGMHLSHTPAYWPQGRGKLERFFRTGREQCLNGFTPSSPEKLQATFAN